MGDKQFYVYIMASGKRGTLYTGVTSDPYLARDAAQGPLLRGQFHRSLQRHAAGVVRDSRNGRESAIRREKQIKEWRRAWKVEMIQEANPTWRDLWEDVAKW